MSLNTHKIIRVELHCHTSASLDSLVPADRYLKRCNALDIDKLAITDHNVIKAALAAKSVAPDKVIVGEEIQTTKGELIAYFMSAWVPSGLDPFTTINLLREQGAVISIPHPFDPIRGKAWGQGDLEAIAPHVDAVETFNARCLGDGPNLEAVAFARKFNLLETVGSDAHTIGEFGRATLRMPNFKDSGTFKYGLSQAEKLTRLSPFYVHIFSNYAKISKKLRKQFAG
jgi:predicted metal-dependent phosphoesterase TrpH